MHVFCDESGNTGVDLLSTPQPVFSLASTILSEEAASTLLAPLLKPGQLEAKYAKLRSKRTGEQALLTFFSSPQLTLTSTKFTIADKRFYLVSHLVDKLIEPCLHEAGIDLYKGDAHVGLANIWYYTGDSILPNGQWARVLEAFLQSVRRLDKASFQTFDQVIGDAYEHAPHSSRDFAAGLAMAAGRLEQFIGVYRNIVAFDPACDCFTLLVQRWMNDTSGLLHITHDRSKPLKRNEGFLRNLMKPLPARAIGFGARKGELPLRVSTLDFADSHQFPQIQIADLVAGAAIDCLLAWSGKRPASSFHESMKATRLSDLFVGGMVPSVSDIGRAAAPSVPGERSIVDGTTDFLKESGYFR
jgi:hypothetical protein